MTRFSTNACSTKVKHNYFCVLMNDHVLQDASCQRTRLMLTRLAWVGEFMAYREAGSCNTEKSEWDEVGEEVTCSICKEIFTEPKTISCLHTFCEACIKLTIESNKRLGSNNCCPMCRTEFPDDVTKIPVNFSIKRLIEIFSKRKKSMQQVRNEIKCGECTMNAPASVVCGLWKFPVSELPSVPRETKGTQVTQNYDRGTFYAKSKEGFTHYPQVRVLQGAWWTAIGSLLYHLQKFDL